MSIYKSLIHSAKTSSNSIQPFLGNHVAVSKITFLRKLTIKNNNNLPLHHIKSVQTCLDITSLQKQIFAFNMHLWNLILTQAINKWDFDALNVSWQLKDGNFLKTYQAWRFLQRYCYPVIPLCMSNNDCEKNKLLLDCKLYMCILRRKNTFKTHSLDV